MGSLQQKLEAIIKDALEDGEADLETLSNGHVCGHVISPEFDGKSYEERRKRIHKVLDAGVRNGDLDKSDLVGVSTLLAYTPDEWNVVLED